MSQENIETVRAVYERWSKGDFRASVDLFDPHVLLVLRPEFGPDSPDAETYLGAEAIAAYTRDSLLKTWADFTMEAEEIVAAGDSALVGVRQRGVGRIGGVPTELRYFTLWTFRGGKVIRIESFHGRPEALEAAGLREQTTSQKNVEVVRAIVEAWNRRDYSAALEAAAPDIRVESALGGDLDGSFDGIAGLQRWLARFWGSFVDFRTEIDEYIPAEDDVVISAHHYGRGKTSGVEVEMRNWQVCTVRDGKVVRYRVFRTKPEALGAAGLRE